MSIKIENYIVSERPPAPKKMPPASNAPPFKLPPKPQQPPVQPATNAAQTRQQHHKNLKHPRTSRLDERQKEELRKRTCEELEQAEGFEEGRYFDREGGGSSSDGFSDESDESDESGTVPCGSTEKCRDAALLREVMGAGALDEPLDCAELSNLLPSG